jgi:hypothetical protein
LADKVEGNMFRSWKKATRQDKTAEPSEFGYTAIYREIIRQVFPAKKIEDSMYWLFFPFVLIFVITLTSHTVKEGFSLESVILSGTILFMFFSFLVILFGWLIGFAYFAFLSPPPPLAWLVARLIVAFKSPHQDRFGLTAREIEHVKAVAETDQAAADWKNGFLTIGILALLLAAIQASTKDIGDFLAAYVLPGPPAEFPFNWQYMSVMLVWVMITGTLLLFAITIFRPLGEFLATEPVNRTVINACHEAVALLEAKALNERLALTLVEKKLIARACDCLVVSQTEERNYGFLRIHSFRDENNQTWLLLPPIAKGRTAARLVWSRRKAQELYYLLKNGFKSKK